MAFDYLRAPFIRFKQRNLFIRSWSELAHVTRLRGASLALVGNGGYLADLRQGKLIDGHDLVIRMNNFRLKGFEVQLGRRCDVLLTNFYSDIAYSNPEFGQASLLVSSSPNNYRKLRRRGIRHRHAEYIAAGMSKLGRREVFVPSLDWFLDRIADLGRYPTTGTCGILLILEHLLEVCGPVFVTGFSFFRGRSHYFSDAVVDSSLNHDVEREAQLVGKRLLPHINSARIRVDPVMTSIFGRTAA
jgi:hypothetical protein